MLKVIEQVIPKDVAEQMLNILEQADWQDGKMTAGGEAINVKDNDQLSRDHPRYKELADVCLRALQQNLLLVSAAIPKVTLPPLFSRYTKGQYYGNHVDNAVQMHAITNELVRTDVSVTLFLSPPDTYEGGELVIEDQYGEHHIKLESGDAILYPSTSLHRVAPVTQGKRIAMVTWIQSMVRSDEKREILHNLDISQTMLRQKLSQQTDIIHHVNGELQELTHVYHNLMRQWAEC